MDNLNDQNKHDFPPPVKGLVFAYPFTPPAFQKAKTTGSRGVVSRIPPHFFPATAGTDFRRPKVRSDGGTSSAA
ncbi:MAG TPA: hypothetical protein VF665_11225 [Longimicrobium sp.]|jgi:hypothetical protein|uniref:hypothetical protein n=1 Tax=Longimicrobium sp. TaxID=2029185 RepID=UPI002EDADD49